MEQEGNLENVQRLKALEARLTALRHAMAAAVC